MFIAVDLPPRPTIVWNADFSARARLRSPLEDEDVTQALITEIAIGETRYRLRNRPILGMFRPGAGGDGIFRVAETGNLILGRGPTVTSAREDWQNHVHAALQRLFGLRDFQMTDDDTPLWRSLTSLIDVVAYQESAPLILTQVGMVRRARPWPTEITWLAGDHEAIDHRLAPAPFVAFKSGQWFEAVVKRNPTTRKIIAVLDVRRIPEIRPLNRQEESDYWQSLRSTKSLPSVPANWASRE